MDKTRRDTLRKLNMQVVDLNFTRTWLTTFVAYVGITQYMRFRGGLEDLDKKAMAVQAEFEPLAAEFTAWCISNGLDPSATRI